MRKDIKTTEGIFPMPVLMIATYNEDGTVDVMNAAWGMMYDRDEVILNLTPLIGLCVSLSTFIIINFDLFAAMCGAKATEGGH